MASADARIPTEMLAAQAVEVSLTRYTGEKFPLHKSRASFMKIDE